MLQNEHNYFSSNLIPDDPMTLLDGAQNNLNDSTLSTLELSDMINFTSIQKRGRKKVRDESSWKTNIIKRKRNSGQAYISHSGNVKRARVVKEGCGQNCKRQCHSRINHEQREKLFHEYWNTRDVNRQRNFLSNTNFEVKTKRILNTGSSGRRKCTRKYFFKVNDETI